LLREPTTGRVDFVHRTFQEYLAAKAAVEADDIGVLVENAHLDQWREVVVMAAGHASRRQREELLAGIVRRDGDGRRQLQLLGLACLETSPELSDTLRTEIRSRAKHLLPPRNPAAARSLAVGGDFVLDLLTASTPHRTNEVKATIQLASYIGGEAALQLVARFGTDRRHAVVRELLQAWPRFDPVRYAESALRDSPLLDGAARIDDPSLIPGLAHLPGLRSLECRFYGGHGDLNFVPGLDQLVSLTVTDPRLRDLTPLAGSRLAAFSLVDYGRAGHWEIVDVGPLRHADTIIWIDLLAPTVGWSGLAALPQLRRLQVAHVGHVAALAELSHLTGLDSMGVRDVSEMTDLTPLAFLTSPRAVGLTNCPDLVDVGLLGRWVASLRRLWLRDCPGVALETLARLADLEFLDLSGSDVDDLSFLSGLDRLEVLRVGHHVALPDLTPLREMPNLRRLWAYEAQDVDLTPLAGKPDFIVYVNRGQNVHGADGLGPGSKVTRH
jgi:hypothetical protein